MPIETSKLLPKELRERCQIEVLEDEHQQSPESQTETKTLIFKKLIDVFLFLLYFITNNLISMSKLMKLI
jgi:hypothetical protein